MHRIQPESISEIVATVRSHLEARRPLAIEGSGSKSGLGRPVEAEALLSLRGLSGIRVYQPDELVAAYVAEQKAFGRTAPQRASLSHVHG